MFHSIATRLKISFSIQQSKYKVKYRIPTDLTRLARTSLCLVQLSSPLPRPGCMLAALGGLARGVTRLQVTWARTAA